MAWLAALLLAGVEIVSDGQPRVRVVTDESRAARFAAELIKQHVVLMAGAALPATGAGPALTLRRTDRPGYAIRAEGKGAVIEGSDLCRAAYDVLESWGCRFDGAQPVVPRRATLSLEPRVWTPERELWVEAERFDPALPAAGVTVSGIAGYDAARLAPARELGYAIGVSSTSFDDFLPPRLHRTHPEWFALRKGKREPRGNFALTNAAARTAYLDALSSWLEAHPEVDVFGLWPEVTSVWCEESEALGHADAYALLWREAATRFSSRRFEILATGLTLRPPKGRVPSNVQVRFRPGRGASGLQGIVGQEIEAVVRAWELRGARVVLEIDAAPDSWCGMPWPCHEAIRSNARRFPAAVLRGGGHVHARLWRDPAGETGLDEGLLQRARRVRSWGHPRDAADLFAVDGAGVGSHIAAVEKLRRIAMREGAGDEECRSAATDAWFGYREIHRTLPARHAAAYRRYMGRDYRRMLEEILPQGAERRVGLAQVRETFDRIEVETDRVRLGIERRTGTVVALHRLQKKQWKGCEGRFFSVVALARKAWRTGGVVEVTSPEKGRIRIDLKGRLSAGGPAWESRLELAGASGKIRQTARIEAGGGIASGCEWTPGFFDRWVCPPHAREGRLTGATSGARLFLPRGTLVYCRAGEEGPALAVRMPGGGRVSVVDGEIPMLLATSRTRTLRIDWILFTDTGELGH